MGLQGRSLALKDWRLGGGEEVAKASKSGPVQVRGNLRGLSPSYA